MKNSPSPLPIIPAIARGRAAIIVFCALTAGCGSDGGGQSDASVAGATDSATDTPIETDSTPPLDTGSAAETDSPPPDTSSGPYARGVSITNVEANQGSATYILERGRAVLPSKRDVGIIKGRPLLLRAYWERGAGFRNRDIRAELALHFGDGTDEVRSVTTPVASVSDPEDPETTFTWLIEKEKVVPGTTYQITLKEADPAFSGTENPGAGVQVPAAAPADLGVTAGDTVLKIVMVPFVPPGGSAVSISQEDKRTVEDTLLELSAVERVEVTWREPVVQDVVYSSTSEPWDVLSQVREADGAGPEVYYHALLNEDGCCNADTFSFTGLGGFAGDTTSAADVWARCALIPIGVEGVGRAALPIVHELGHNQGRRHAPCGNGDDPDPDFPYPEGRIGRQGYGILTADLHSSDPNIARPYKDVMSYCQPAWYSDYNFEAIRVRAQTLSSWGRKRKMQIAKVPVLMASVSPDGFSYHFTRAAAGTGDTCAAPPSAESITAALESPGRQPVPLCVEETRIPDNPLRAAIVYLPSDVADRPGGAVRLSIDDRSETVQLSN